MKTLNDLVLTIQHYLSDYVLIIALLGGGIWFTFKLGFIQVRGFGEGMTKMECHHSRHWQQQLQLR